MKFREPIKAEKVVIGSLTLVQVKRHGNLYVASLTYDIENGKSKGDLEYALRFENP